MTETKKFKRNFKKHINDSEINISEDGMSYQMISKIMGITVQDVKNIEASAIRKMQIPNEKNKKLRNYLKITLEPKKYLDELSS